VELRCGFLPGVRLWVVPGPQDASQLEAEGVRPGAIWTLEEVETLFAQRPTRELVEFTVRAKLFFDGEVAHADQ